MNKATNAEPGIWTSQAKQRASVQLSGTIVLVISYLFYTTASASPFADADLELGHTFHEDMCVACHAQRFDGEKGSSVYTRTDRRVQSPGALTQQLTACTAMLNLDLFPEDEFHIAGYLNKHFYKFD